MKQLIRLLAALAGAVIAPAIALGGGGGLKEMAAMPGTSFRGALPPLSAAQQDLASRLRRHVSALASAEHNMARYAELEKAAQYLEQVLGHYGYTVRRQEFRSGTRPVRNLEVVISGALGHPKELVIVGAHYDSAPGTPGANDNGTGVAAVLELARLLKNAKPAEGMELRLVLFVNEEPPYFKSEQMGSWVHARALHAQGERVSAMLSLETIGYYSDEKGSQHYPAPLDQLYPSAGNFIGFVGDLQSRALVHRAIAAFRRHAQFPSEGLAAPASIPGVDWSDHWAYRQFGYPAIMVTDTAPYRYPYYHSAEDTPDKVDYERLARVVSGLEQVIRELAGAR